MFSSVRYGLIIRVHYHSVSAGCFSSPLPSSSMFLYPSFSPIFPHHSTASYPTLPTLPSPASLLFSQQWLLWYLFTGDRSGRGQEQVWRYSSGTHHIASSLLTPPMPLFFPTLFCSPLLYSSHHSPASNYDNNESMIGYSILMIALSASGDRSGGEREQVCGGACPGRVSLHRVHQGQPP